MRARHRDVIEFYIEQNMDKFTNQEEAEELSLKVNSVIDRLIEKEGILIVSMDAEDRLDRELSINVNYEVPSLG